MALTSFATPLTAAPLDNLVISNNNGVGYSFADPGVYTLVCNVPWYYHASDSQAIADMTPVDAGEVITVTVTTSTQTKYCKTDLRGEFALRITYDAPTPQSYNANLAALAAVTVTAAGTALLDDANAAAQRVTIGLGPQTVATAAPAAVVTTAAGLASYGFTEAQANDIVAQLNLAIARLNDLVTKVTTLNLLAAS